MISRFLTLSVLVATSCTVKVAESTTSSDQPQSSSDSIPPVSSDSSPDNSQDGGSANSSDDSDNSSPSGDDSSNDDNSDNSSNDDDDDDNSSDDDDDNDNSSDDDDDDDDDDTEPSVKFDVGFGDIPPPPGKPCDKIDFVFVIDNSGSMADEQTNLINSFPGFIDGIRDEIMADEFHIMVIDTDSVSNTSTSTNCSGKDCTCTPAPTCCVNLCDSGQADICNGQDCDDLDPGSCDYNLGSGRIQNGNNQQMCNIQGNLRYLKESQPNLEDTFSCMARVGITGDGNEKPMDAMIAALSDEANEPGGCNEGFLRDEALLVVVVITDEEESGMMKSGGTPASWHQALIDAKDGVEEKVVSIGFIGDLDLPNPTCQPFDETQLVGAEASPRLREFIRLFGDNGLEASVCADDYAPFLVEAVGVIDTACDDIPG